MPGDGAVSLAVENEVLSVSEPRPVACELTLAVCDNPLKGSVKFNRIQSIYWAEGCRERERETGRTEEGERNSERERESE